MSAAIERDGAAADCTATRPDGALPDAGLVDAGMLDEGAGCGCLAAASPSPPTVVARVMSWVTARASRRRAPLGRASARERLGP